MADQIAVVTFTTPASPGTLDITSGSITETFKAAILIFTKETSDETDNDHGMLGIGFIGADGDVDQTQCFVALQAENGVASAQDMNTLRDFDADCMRVSSGVNTTPLTIVGAYTAAVSGGFRINFTTTTVQAKCTAIIFAGLTSAVTGDCTFNETAPSHEDVGVGGSEFEPDVVIFRSSDNVTSGDTPNATLALGFATNTSPIQQVSAYVNWDELADPTDSDGYLRSDCCSGAFTGDRIVRMDRFFVTSFDSTGFNAQAADANPAGGDSPQANYLALKFSGQFNVGCVNELVSGSTGNQDFTGLGFTPGLVLGMSTLMTSEDALIDGGTASAAGYFVTGDYGERAYTVHNEENLNIGGAVVTSTHTRQEDVGLLTYEHTGTIAQRATWVSGISGGFRLNFSTATAGYFTALGIALELPALVTTETEEIGDAAVVFLSQSLVLSETVEIEEDSGDTILETMDVSDSEGPAGWTYEARTERGTALSGGAEAGTVL